MINLLILLMIKLTGTKSNVQYKDSPSIEDYFPQFYSMVINNAYDKSIGFHKDQLKISMIWNLEMCL